MFVLKYENDCDIFNKNCELGNAVIQRPYNGGACFLNDILKLNKTFPGLDLHVDVDGRGIATVSGVCDTWETLVDVGHYVGKCQGVKSVVSDMHVPGVEISRPDYGGMAVQGRSAGVIAEADVVIVGAGVIGCAIARELSRYQLNIIVCEKGEDVATGSTKANNGDIHPGYLEKPGYQKVALNVKGNPMYDNWARELDFSLNRCGNMVIIEDERFRPDLEAALAQSRENGVYAEIVDRERALELEPTMRECGVEPVAALYVPSMAIVAPWEVTVALAENAADNGVRFMLDNAVADVETGEDGITAVVTERGVIRTRYLINCAGLYSDDISEMAGDRCFTIHPRKGTIAIFDKSVPPYNHLFRIIDGSHQVNKKVSSKGGGMGTTIGGNALLGPSALEVPDKEDLATSRAELAYAMSRNCKNDIGYGNIIRIFAGTRAATFTEDFFIEGSPKVRGLINVAGIQSPGLSSAPAIAELVVGILREEMQRDGRQLLARTDFNPIRKGIKKFSEMTREEQDEAIQKNPAYGRIVCRCEQITEGEILDVLRSPIVPTTVDAIKRRTRAGMGRCQGGFCQIRVLELLAQSLGRPWTEIDLNRRGSEILLQDNRG